MSGAAWVVLSLAGCSAMHSPDPASDATMPALRQPWISAEAQGDLLYISVKYSNATNVYTFPRGRFVGSLTYVGSGGSGGLCSNAHGDVFITTQYVIYEYPHGDASPVAMLGNAFGFANGCSVDPTTGDVAATSPKGGVAIYSPGPRYEWHLPRLFAIPGVLFGGYDGRGDLFVDGQASGGTAFVRELLKGGDRFEDVTLDRSLGTPGNIEWDGRYLAVGSRRDLLIHRFAVSGTQGRQVGAVMIEGPSQAEQFWIQGSTVIAPAFGPSWFAGLWRYPGGGFDYKTIMESSAYGATVSVASRVKP